MKRVLLAIFASGSGTNAEAIIRFFRGKKTINVALLIASREGIGAIARAEKFGVPVKIITAEQWSDPQYTIKILQDYQITAVALAGFLRQVPPQIVAMYPERMFNIHPSLLPKYGGKGMHGMHVHRAVLENKETETGITIHYVSDQLDEGKIITQQKVKILSFHTPETLAQAVNRLELTYYPTIISLCLLRWRSLNPSIT